MTRIYLREMVIEDWEGVHAYASQDKVCQYQPWGPNTEEDSLTFVTDALQDFGKSPRSRYVFSVIEEETESMIGVGEFNIYDAAHKGGVISYIIHPDYWGQGVATKVGERLLRFGFDELSIHRIQATCDPRNRGSARVIEKLGMTYEGCIRDDLYIKDGWRDSSLYSMLDYEWKERLG